jgi:hypothetical protein
LLNKLSKIKCLLISCTYLSACASFQPGLMTRDNLLNRGPVIVSRTNPYIASNILMAREVKLSPTLKGFLKIRGTPEAIEIRKNFFQPYVMFFYYSSQREQYVLEEVNDDWVIRGPEQIRGDSSQALASLAPEKITTTEKPAEPLEKEVDLEDLMLPDSKPIDPPKKISNSDDIEQVDGDILHTVKYKGETLRLIAEWYTGKSENAPRIARINGFKDANSLILDQKIRIPRYLATNDSPLSKERVESYSKKF